MRSKLKYTGNSVCKAKPYAKIRLRPTRQIREDFL